MQPADLILAILGEASNAGVSLSKTKLLKLLYLIDLETVRQRKETATGWRWKFLHFGPWAAEYDTELDDLTARGRLTTTVLPGDRETQIVRSDQADHDASTLNESEIRIATRRVLNRWLSRDLPEILDYVYFDTEPMHVAQRGSELNFDTVPRGPSDTYKRPMSNAGPKKLEELRRKLGFTQSAQPPRTVTRNVFAPPVDYIQREQPTRQQFTPPTYDAAALELLDTLEDD